MEIKRILKPIRNFFSKHWRKWTILVILAILLYTGIVFYQYVYKPIYQEREIASQKLEIKKVVYTQIMESYFKCEDNINQVISKDYPDPFK